MTNFLSPGAYVSEVDNSNYELVDIENVGVFAGSFTKGPIGSYVLITSIKRLIEVFGKPTDANYNDWFQCYNFLKYDNSLYVARVGSQPIAEES